MTTEWTPLCKTEGYRFNIFGFSEICNNSGPYIFELNWEIEKTTFLFGGSFGALQTTSPSDFWMTELFSIALSKALTLLSKSPIYNNSK